VELVGSYDKGRLKFLRITNHCAFPAAMCEHSSVSLCSSALGIVCFYLYGGDEG
jgi:hypothetical protein